MIQGRGLGVPAPPLGGRGRGVAATALGCAGGAQVWTGPLAAGCLFGIGTRPSAAMLCIWARRCIAACLFAAILDTCSGLRTIRPSLPGDPGATEIRIPIEVTRGQDKFKQTLPWFLLYRNLGPVERNPAVPDGAALVGVNGAAILAAGLAIAEVVPASITETSTLGTELDVVATGGSVSVIVEEGSCSSSGLNGYICVGITSCEPVLCSGDTASNIHPSWSSLS